MNAQPEPLPPTLLKALAKMLPEVLKFEDRKLGNQVGFLFWKDKINENINLHLLTHDAAVKPTEYLHLCWMVEEGLTDKEWQRYIRELILLQFVNGHLARVVGHAFVHPAPTQRINALAKVKGIEV